MGREAASGGLLCPGTGFARRANLASPGRVAPETSRVAAAEESRFMGLGFRRRSKLALARAGLTSGFVVLTAAPAFADQASGAQAAMLGAVMLFSLVLAIAAYVYLALALKTIAEKTHTENPWWAWIPIVQAVLMLNIARKPVWWIVLMFIPFVNILITVIVWMAIAEARNKPSWWGILILVPIVGIAVPGYLAWAD